MLFDDLQPITNVNKSYEGIRKPNNKNVSSLSLYVEPFLLQTHNFFHQHSLFNRLHFCQPM